MPENKSQGEQTGMGIMQFFANLFDANELAPISRKLTDEQILLACQAEFPGRKIWEDFSDGSTKSKRYTVNTYRIKYNNGIMTRGVPPVRKSYRYDNRGRKVDPRYGMTPLLPEEVTHFNKLHSVSRIKKLDAHMKELGRG